MDNNFYYERYSANPIKCKVPQVNINSLLNPPKPKTIDDLFDDYIKGIELQRGYKLSRRDKRDLYKKFCKKIKK